MSRSGWSAADLPDQTGRTFVITGANSGLGLVTARELARVGARVVLAVRSIAKGEQAAQTITGTVEVRPLDLADLDSVRRFAEEWDGPIDGLINNAGIMAVPQGRTAQGFELQIGTNHLGPFALTNLLLDRITDRVVTLSSMMHRTGKIDLDDLNGERRRYRAWPAYGQSKLANLLFTLELDRRLAATGSAVRSLAAHPGYAATHLQSHGSPMSNLLGKVGNVLIAQSAENGALPSLFAATQDLPGNTYVGPGGLQESRGAPKIVGRTQRAQDGPTARRLWTLSEELTGVPSAV
ncbi:MAG: oxidoreductase [Solirubrobacteraceae bacterium]